MRAKTHSNLMVSNTHLLKEDCDPLKNQERYKRLIEKLNYTAHPSSVLGQFMNATMVKHWTTLKQISCCLKGSLGLDVLYKKSKHTHIDCFEDADRTSSKIKRPMIAYCGFIAENLILVEIRNRSVVVKFNVESQHKIMTQSTCGVI